MRRTVSSFLLVLSLVTVIPFADAGRVQEPKEYDRLDGKGATSKKVDVIEWENNLEIHVYPKGSLRTLGLKIDRTKKEKPVMVIEYAFNSVPYTLIRRALLSIPMKDGFKTYIDATADGYDKVIISNNTILEGVQKFTLAAEPTQLYPDYHPALGQDEGVAPSAAEPAKSYQRKSASEGAQAPSDPGPGIQFRSAEDVQQDSRGTMRKRNQQPSTVDEDGAIKSFAF